jgi:deazaflavin-dependent oxidoreductase (nitroreductase family)
MPLPRWLAKINKRLFNPFEVKRGKRPVLTHTGRFSGKTYHTPLDAHAVEGGYIFVANYGSKSDWCQNILATGSARLRIGGEVVELGAPRLLDQDEAWQELPEGTKPMPGYLNITEYLRMDVENN